MQPACASSDCVADSQTLYAQGQYSSAAELLRKSLVTHPDDAQEHYLLANCLMQLGKTDDAKSEYERARACANNFSVRNFCEMALTALSKQDKRDHNVVAKLAPASNVTGSAKLKDELPAIPEPIWSSLSPIDRDHVELNGSGNIFNRARQDVFWAISIMPRQFKDALWAKDVRIVICSNLQEVADANAWGKFKGASTWADLFGFTSGRMVYIAVTPGASKPYIFKRPGMVLTHEIGHAFDFNALPSFQSPGMEDCYRSDLASQAQNSPWHSESRLEIFADLVSGILLTNAKVEFKKEKFQGQRRDFPKSCSYVTECLSHFGIPQSRILHEGEEQLR